jgi:hypothetical protein
MEQQYHHPSQAPKNSTYKTIAIVSFVIGLIFQIIGLIPIIGFIFGLLSVVCDIAGFIFLCLI